MQEDRTALHWAFIEIEQNKAAKMPVFQAAKNSLVDYRGHNLLEFLYQMTVFNWATPHFENKATNTVFLVLNWNILITPDT